MLLLTGHTWRQRPKHLRLMKYEKKLSCRRRVNCCTSRSLRARHTAWMPSPAVPPPGLQAVGELSGWSFSYAIAAPPVMP